MNRTVMGAIAVVAATVVAGCTAVRQQKALPAHEEGTYKNLKLLPLNITHDELIATMRNYSRALGVHCDHCHVKRPGAAPETTPPAAGHDDHDDMDFASDAKPEKEVARVMMAMTRELNRKYISQVNEYTIDVSCITCHRGKGVPDNAVIGASQNGARRPEGAAPEAPPEHEH